MEEERHYIPKSYQFERDMDTSNSGYKRYDTIEFKDDANRHFLHHDINELLDGSDDSNKELASMIDTFMNSQKERLDILEAYSNGNNWTILQGDRRIEEGKADYRIRHNFGGYISNVTTSYGLSKPISITYQDDEKDTELIEQINWDNDLDSLNYELGYDASRYGRAFELHFRDKQHKDRIVLINPQDMFTIRSFDVENEIIGAVHVPVYNGEVYLTVYTDTQIIEFEPFELGNVKLAEKERKEHFYSFVPVVEWFNNRYRTGDFETSLPGIDAYDSAQSDTANYMSDLNDAALVLRVDDIDSLGGQDGVKSMTDANVFVLENGTTPSGNTVQGDANYIYKQYDVQGTEAYKKRLRDDIFRLSNVPDLTDEKFGTDSGIAIQYKLIGLKQIQSMKENYFIKALRRRYDLIDQLHKSVHEPPINPDKLTFTFHPNLPQDIWDEVDKFIRAGGELSQKTLRELASFTDSETELERLANEGITAGMTDQEKQAFMNLGGNDEQDSDEVAEE